LAEIISIVGLSKTFPGTRALTDVDFDVCAGEVHALVGHNGSGKSTLIKVLAGYHAPDPGAEVYLDGELTDFVHVSRSHAGADRRLSVVHQDLGLVSELNTIDNLALHGGFARNRIGGIHWRRQAARARELMAPFTVDFDIYAPLAKATPVERTIVAIAGALQGWSSKGGVLVLDEPTAVLPPNEVGRLFDIVKNLRAGGAGIVYVSHRLDEVFELADRVTVLRGGINVATRNVTDLNKQQLVELMLGTEARADYRAVLPDVIGDQPLLEVRDLGGQYLRSASFTVSAGEVLGIAGLPVDGRDELPRLLTDAAPTAVSGSVRMKSVSDQWFAVQQWDRQGIVLLPPDRAKEGILSAMSVGENMSLSTLDRFGPSLKLDKPGERRFVNQWVDKLGVITTGPEASITTLSGGNQQKVLFGRVLAVEPKILVLCEPTAGVDIGARQAIYELVAEQVRDGLGVIVASSDVGDLEAFCSRVLVLHHGVIVDELGPGRLTEQELVHAMEGIESGVPG
jgi:ABC-type sugar transport system ATPase subunit